MSILQLADVRRVDMMSFPSEFGRARDLYENLMHAPQHHLAAARAFINEQLESVRDQPCDLPAWDDFSSTDATALSAHLSQWMKNGATTVTAAYHQYLQQRKSGMPRRYFRNRAHALHFLRAVAPTKLVDGAWLYGLLPYWRELRLQPLVVTYLEELGDGQAAQNHVQIYKHLLMARGCDDLSGLGEESYIQGAVQLALGHLAMEYLPEVIGYNLGYEQLPLHLLITAYELDELGIDPHYFRLHVTIDNAASGHAQKAVRTVVDNLPQLSSGADFYQRMLMGYKLNEVGPGSVAMIESFDIDHELHLMLERKREFAGTVHSDFCRIDGRTVNEWLNGPQSIELFLNALQKRGWIRRHADPQQSRFWQLVNGEKAAMFGVFTEYESQLLYDWIAGDWQRPYSDKHVVSTVDVATRAQGNGSAAALRLVSAIQQLTPSEAIADDFGVEQKSLLQELARMEPAQSEQRLIALTSPAMHASPIGLQATRILSSIVRG